MKKRKISTLISVALIVSMCSMTTFATESETATEVVETQEETTLDDGSEEAANEESKTEPEQDSTETAESESETSTVEKTTEEETTEEETTEEETTEEETTEEETTEEETTEVIPVAVDDDGLGGLIEGSSVYWSVSDDGSTLFISGEGKVRPYANFEKTPWYDIRADIKTLVISEGITELGQKDFMFRKLESIYLPKSITSIDERAFGNGGGFDVREATVYYPCTISSSSLIGGLYGARSLSWEIQHAAINKYGYCEECGELVNTENLVLRDDNGNDTNFTWTLKDGTLTLSGNGALPTFRGSGQKAPWYSMGADITKIVIEEGITVIGNKNFPSLVNVSEIVLPNSLTNIKSDAFGTNANNQIKDAVVTCGCVFSDKLFESGNYGAANITWKKSGHDIDESTGKCKNCGTLLTNNTITVDGVTYDNISWNYENGVLTISGKGEIPSLTSSAGNDMPWYKYASQIKKLVVEDGITKIGSKDFYYLVNVTDIVLPNSLKSIAPSAFGGNSVKTRVKAATVYYYEGFQDYLITRSYNVDSLTWRKYIATVGDDVYASLPKAIEASGNGSVKLISDAVIYEDETVTLDKNVNINLNGHSITVNGKLVISGGTYGSDFDVILAKGGVIELSGGTFNSIPEGATIAEGYKVIDNKNGTYTVEKPKTLYFEGNDADITVSVEGKVLEPNADGGYSIYRSETVTASAVSTVDGKKFEGWYTSSGGTGTKLSGSAAYKFYVSKNSTYYAYFVDESTEVEEEPTASITDCHKSTDSTGAKAIYVGMDRSIPNTYKVSEVGFLLGTNYTLGYTNISSNKNVLDEKYDDIESKLVYETCKYSTTRKTSGRSGRYSINMAVGNQTSSYTYVRGYVLLTNSNGDEIILYSSNIVAVAYDLVAALDEQ